MKRRHFLQSGTAAGGMIPLAGCCLTHLFTAARSNAADPPSIASRFVPGSNIRDYLSGEARRITEGSLAGIATAEDWRKSLPEQRRQYFEMMGLDHWWTEVRTPPPFKVTGIVEREHYHIEKLYYESVPNLCVTANLYVPRKRMGRVPAILYVCGHSQNQNVAFQAHARKFAELGFVCMIVETIQLGEVQGYHHGCYREGWWHWYSRGYTPAGIELMNGIRALDLLVQRPEVDPEKLGVTGISGGGAASWWIAAGDPRIKAAAPVCGTASLFSHIHDRTIDGHCDCMWWINSYRWDLAELGTLIAPRPFMIASADHDGIFTIESIRQVHAQLQDLYGKLGAGQNLALVETPGGHSYHQQSRTMIFSFFLRHLMGRDVPASETGDIDERPEVQEKPETLRVFVDGPPPGNRMATIHENFFTPMPPPSIPDVASHQRERERVVAALKKRTFGAFPGAPPPLDVQMEYEFEEDVNGYRFGFTSEAGWRLHGQALVRKQTATPAPAVVALHSPSEGRGKTRSFLLGINAPWVRAGIETRGTGDTAWADELDWHLRRATAWTGRTIASMRVWDTLRALGAVRELPQVDAKNISLAARGEMCAVALYAALLDGRVRTLFLEDPPATQNTPGEKDGRGPAMEMLGCLRITDLPQVAGLLWPAELVLIGETPATYEWTEALFKKLGGPARISRVKTVGEWKPA
jgi:cephalosporin-C deacetylase-like acetyl esterase